jgi:hypothetical protein
LIIFIDLIDFIKTVFYVVGLPDLNRMIESRKMIWAGHIAGMERRGMHTRFWWE